MMPVYRYMDSHPIHANEMPSNHNYHPNFESFSAPVMMVDPSKPIVPNQPWPYPTNFVYSAPTHSCCNHANSPGFYSYAPSPNFSSPQFQCCLHEYHPPFPNAFPVQYFPSPYYMREQPRYDHDKPKDGDFHCCGCPNHMHSQSNGGSVKVEELPDVDRKKDNSLVPFELKNYPYPVVWIPDEYLKNKELRKPVESDRDPRNTVSKDVKSLKNVQPHEHESGQWNGCFPLDMKSLQSLLQGNNGRKMQEKQNNERFRQVSFPIDMKKLQSMMQGDDQRRIPDQHNDDQKSQASFPFDMKQLQSLAEDKDGRRMLDQKNDNANIQPSFPFNMKELQSLLQSDEPNEDKMHQFPFPIFWMPSYDKHDESEKKKHGEMKGAAKLVEEQGNASKVSPAEPASIADNNKNSPVVHESSVGEIDPEVKQKRFDQRTIPVRQIEVPKENKTNHAESRAVAASPKHTDSNGSGKATGTSIKSAPSSSQKVSKLPPVCLRVDPLPKKRNGHKNSRSPSPPGVKQMSQDAAKASLPSDNTLSGNEEKEAKQSRCKSVEVVEKKSEDKHKEHTNESESLVPDHKSVSSQNEASDSQNLENIGLNDATSCSKESLELRNVNETSNLQANQDNVTSDSKKSDDDESKAQKKILSDDDAALRIQSAYRGFEVRKWELLKKLKQIAEVQEQLAEVKNKIHDLELCPHMQTDEKRRVLIGEIIMSLLLKLDAIQGLHPSFRDVRKSLARKLVMLQEKLDFLGQTKPSKELSCDSSITEERQARDICSDSGCASNNVTEFVADTQSGEFLNPSLDDKGKLVDFEKEVQSDAFDTTGSTNFVRSSEEPQEATTDVKLTAPADEQRNGKNIEENTQMEDVEPEVTRASSSAAAEQTPEELMLEELPAGVIDEEPEIIRVTTSDAAKQTPEKVMLEELPAGAIDEEPEIIRATTSDAAEQIEEQYEELPLAPSNEGNVTIDPSSMVQEAVQVNNEATPQTDASSMRKESPAPVESEQQHIEGFDGVLNLEPADQVTAEREKEDEKNQALEADNDINKQVEISQTEETQQVSSLLQKESGENEVGQGYVASDIASVTEVATAVPALVEETQVVCQDNKKQATSEGSQEERKDKDVQLEVAAGSKEIQWEEDESPKKVTEVEHEEEMKEVPPVSSADGRSSLEKMEVEDERKLVEENEKMRKMVEKLMEAGKEQLDVISKLSGRVKDLEKKLLKRKKVRAGRYRRATSSNNSPRKLI